jgi:hypothetical protein
MYTIETKNLIINSNTMKSEEMEPGKTYNTTHHMCMSIEGCLRNHRGLKIKIFNNEDGSQTSDKEARAYLAECQAKGWKVIPFGEPCEGFDYFGHGCPGHLNSVTESKDN